jgi:predicted AAA+ superfamily ATPase
VFILYRLEGFSRNLRKEITKNAKWYFFDNGIRNAVIADFKSLENRNDTGQLWENYVISERLKYQQFSRKHANNFFWRTYDQQEVDWVEERDGSVSATEFKWTGSKTKPPAAWRKSYPEAEFNVISHDNYLEWLT